jgi:hypothetical protein
MVKIDNYYKVVASTFGIAYFIGIIVALIYSTYKGDLVTQVGTDFIKNLSLTSSIYFKQTIYEIFNNSVNLFLIPFSYLIAAVQYSYIHVNLLTSSFLGQVKLLVQLIPQFLFFISYIIFSTLGIKTILLIVKLFLNNFIIKENKYKIKEKFFNKDDINLLYIALISIVLGAIIQTHLIKVLFIFFINLKSIAYILIIIIYLFLFVLSAYVTYKTINEYFKKNKKENL